MKRVDSGIKKANGKPRYKLEWDMEFLDHMAAFVHSLRMGKRLCKLVEEARNSGYCRDGRIFMASYSKDGKMRPPGHAYSLTYATDNVRAFIRRLHKGELPAKYCVPGTYNPVDSGIARRHQWLNNADGDFMDKPRVRRKKAADDGIDRSSWTVEMWADWWRNVNEDKPEEDEASLLVGIKRQAIQQGLDKPACDHKWVKGTCVRCWEEK
jgi:hypothetical protein